MTKGFSKNVERYSGLKSVTIRHVTKGLYMSNEINQNEWTVVSKRLGYPLHKRARYYRDRHYLGWCAHYAEDMRTFPTEMAATKWLDQKRKLYGDLIDCVNGFEVRQVSKVELTPLAVRQQKAMEEAAIFVAKQMSERIRARKEQSAA